MVKIKFAAGYFIRLMRLKIGLTRISNMHVTTLLLRSKVMATIFLTSLVLLSGCSHKPAFLMHIGTPEPLMQMIRSGQIGVNEPQKPFSDNSTITPLCLAISGDKTEAVTELLNLGADVNLPCYNEGLGRPLDIAYLHLGMSTKPNAIKIARILMAEGALRQRGALTEQDLVAQTRRGNQISVEVKAETQEAKRRQAEQEKEDARQSAINRQGFLAIAGAVAIGKATSGKNFSDEQRSGLVDAYVKDRVNTANGTESNNFGQAADSVKHQLDMSGVAAASQARLKAESQLKSESQRGADSRRALGLAKSGDPINQHLSAIPAEHTEERHICTRTVTLFGNAYIEADARAKIKMKSPGSRGVNIVGDPYTVVSATITCKREDTDINPEYKCVGKEVIDVSEFGGCGKDGVSKGVSK